MNNTGRSLKIIIEILLFRFFIYEGVYNNYAYILQPITLFVFYRLLWDRRVYYGISADIKNGEILQTVIL